jgi:hypothetical protein
MKKVALVKDHKDVIRDMNSKAILSIDKEGLANHKKRRAERLESQKAISEINNMKEEIQDIKALLQRVLEKIG